MSVPLPTISFAVIPPVVGQKGTIDLSNFHISAAPVDPIEGPFSRLEIGNESGAGFIFTFPQQPMTHYRVFANTHTVLPIPPGESKATWTVEYVFGSSFPGMVLLTYYEQWEADAPPYSVTGGSNPGNQTRTISPGVTPFPLIGRSVALAVGNTILRTDTFFPSGPPLISPGHPVAYIYLYWAKIRLSVPPASTLVGADLTLAADLMNGGAIVLSNDMHYMDVYASTQPAASFNLFQGTDDFITNNPGTYLFNGFALPVTGVQWRLTVNSIVGAPIAYYSFGVGLDLINPVAPGTHGNFTFNTGGVY